MTVDHHREGERIAIAPEAIAAGHPNKLIDDLIPSASKPASS